MQSNIGVLLHPRLPPLVRSMPHVESLALIRAEESQEETEALSALGVESIHSKEICDQDVEMKDPTAHIHNHATPSTPPNPPITQAQSSFSPRPQSIEDQNRAIQLLLQPTKTEMERPATDLPFQPTTPFPLTGHRPTAQTVSVPITIPAREDDDEGQEMPIINMDSDSDEGED